MALHFRTKYHQLTIHLSYFLSRFLFVVFASFDFNKHFCRHQVLWFSTHRLSFFYLTFSSIFNSLTVFEITLMTICFLLIIANLATLVEWPQLQQPLDPKPSTLRSWTLCWPTPQTSKLSLSRRLTSTRSSFSLVTNNERYIAFHRHPDESTIVFKRIS